jgi:hypothetical protein
MYFRNYSSIIIGSIFLLIISILITSFGYLINSISIGSYLINVYNNILQLEIRSLLIHIISSITGYNPIILIYHIYLILLIIITFYYLHLTTYILYY